MTTALFIGRFQPFHNGHLSIIKKILKEVDSLLLVVGSSQESNTTLNPFSAEERIKMIKAVIEKEKISNVEVYSLTDIGNDDLWVKHVESSLPNFDIVYSGPGLNLDLFKKSSYKVISINKIGNISSNDIRKRIASNSKWEHLVPRAVVDEIKKSKGVERIKKLMI